VATILEDIQRIGGLQAAKKRLRTRSCASRHQIFNQPREYFLATKRIGRMDLSVEAIALDPKWQGLFTPEEIDEATTTLSEHGFNPALEMPSGPSTTSLVPTETQPSLARIRLGERRGALDLDSLTVLTGLSSGCEVTAKAALALREGRRPFAHRVVRKHIGECVECADLHRDLAAAFERFDEDALIVWAGLLRIFQASMELEDEQLKRFMLNEPEDYEDPEQYEVDLDGQLSDSIRPICAWRAVRVGCQVGRFMSAFASTFADPGDLWLKWRKKEIQGWVSTFVRETDPQLFALALLARNLLLVRAWPNENEGVLWVPADGDLFSIGGYVRVDATRDMEDWAEILGEPPQDLNLLGILYLAHLAAVAQAEESESTRNEPAAARELRERLGRFEEMLRTIQSSQAEAKEREEERQDAIIAQLERMVSHMENADRHACEESLLAELPGVYEKFTPQVRRLILASEQICRTPGFAAPGSIVHALATAFELQLQHSVLSGVFERLKYRKAEKLKPLPEWTDAEHRDRPLWWPGARADACGLGAMRLILRHPHAAIGEFFDQFGLNRIDIQLALDTVYSYRNPAAHGDCFDIGTAEAIRADWFHWGGRPGGVFSVFFRNA
jgi:hypothetical protein